jgi:signal transduction histidine kinase
VLIVEDDVDIREQVVEMLAGEGFEVDVATDGEEALTILRAHPSFDLILLDLMLPRTDGWQFRVAQRADPALSSIPVIALSASKSAHAKAIDADAFVSKPFETDALVHAVRYVLERRRSAQMDRFVSLGRMAAGIAHEVNNPLTYIYASLSMAETALANPSSPSSENRSSQIDGALASIRRAVEGVDRIRAIMSGVRLLIQAPDARRAPLDVRDIIETSLGMVELEAQRKARIEKHLDEVPIVSGNAGQLTQLVLNLVTNALDCFPEGKPEEHTISIRTTTSDRREVVIEVEDTGPGIPEEVRGKIFEPFFTMKPPGDGTGLGLSICQGIARSHGGTIEVESEPGQGTVFRVRLPGTQSAEGAPPSSSSRRQRLLIVEDDPLVGDALGRLLGQKYETTVLRDGAAAVDVLERGALRPDVILCDFFVGTTTGEDIYRGLRRLGVHFTDRMIFMTGAAFTGRARAFLGEIPNPCLDKPFSPADFEKALERLPSRLRAASRTQLRAQPIDRVSDQLSIRGHKGRPG